jgi:hypothetical protein
MVMPRYQRAGVRVAAMPQVTTVGLQEAARTNQTLAQSMDRLASFAFNQAEVEAQVKGAEYGALNAPSQQQLNDAIAAGEDVTQIVPGDTSTVFGRAARTTALDALSTEFELQAREEIVKMQTDFENKAIDLEDMQQGLDSLVREQADIMRRISPQAATRLSASLGVASNSAYLAAAKSAAKEARTDQEIRYRAGVDLYIRNAESIVRAGPTVAEDGSMVSVDDKINTLREQIAVAAQEIDDVEFYEAKIGELDAAVAQAKVGVVMDEALLKPAASLKIITGDGQFEDPEVQATFDSMDNATRRALLTEVQGALSTQFSLESAADAKRERERAKRSTELQAQFTGAMLAQNDDEANSILEELRRVDPSAWESKSEVFASPEGVDDTNVIVTLRRLSLNQKLTQEDVDSAFSSGKLSLSTYKTFMTDLEQQRNQSFNRAVDWLKLSRGMPEATLINFNSIQRKADREVAQIKSALIEKLIEDPSVDPYQFVKQEVARLEEEEGDLANTALREQAFRLGETLRSQMPGASAQELLERVTNDPDFYRNPQRRQNAIDNLLPLLIQLEAQ